MFDTTLYLSSPTDKIEIIDGQRIRIVSEKRQSVELYEKEIKPRFFINTKTGFVENIVLMELNPNGLWYNINNKLERKENYMQFTLNDLNRFLQNGEWKEVVY